MSPFKSWGNLGSLKVTFNFHGRAAPLKERLSLEERRSSTFNSLLLGRTGNILMVLQTKQRWSSHSLLLLAFLEMKARFVAKKNVC